jgi:hypothetical protein
MAINEAIALLVKEAIAETIASYNLVTCNLPLLRKPSKQR